jgi:hypothetical protein
LPASLAGIARFWQVELRGRDVHADVGLLFRECPRRRLSDAGFGTGNDGNLAGQPVNHPGLLEARAARVHRYASSVQ